MANPTSVMIAGDRYMKPAVIQKLIEEHLEERLLKRVTFRSLEFPYPDDPIQLHDHTVIPSGMSWSDFDVRKSDGDIAEYYGNRDALTGKLNDSEILVIHGTALPRDAIQSASSLRLIVVLRGGPRNIDIRAARQAGITIVNTPGKTARAVAEATLGGILGLSRNIVDGAVRLRRHDQWYVYYTYEQCGFELAGRTLGLIGFGHIARELATILSAFDLRDVLVFDPYVANTDIIDAGGRSVDLNTLLESSDIISLHARLNDASRGMIAEPQFGRMLKRPIIVNTARGGLLDYRALHRALTQSKVAGAVLDVFDDRAYGELRPLVQLPNVVATPHLAGGSRETVHRGAIMAAEEIRRYLEGRPYVNEMA